MELKAVHRQLETAFTGNLTDYKDTIPHLFWYNALIILSNGSESKVGSVTAGWEHFAEWKKVGSGKSISMIFFSQKVLRKVPGNWTFVVVSQSQNEIREMEEKGLDIRPHRRRMVEEDLDTKFKDPDEPFRLVFVCGMWMTGFDVPSCSTIYLDKPMRNHTLMQTIARANRVFPEKVNGLIVDYVGVFRRLERVLAIYGSGAGGEAGEGEKPIKDKSALLEELSNAIAEARAFCEDHQVDLEAIQEAEGFDRIRLLDDAVDALVATDETRKRYLNLTDGLGRLYKAVLPDPKARELAPVCSLPKKILLTT